MEKTKLEITSIVKEGTEKGDVFKVSWRHFDSDGIKIGTEGVWLMENLIDEAAIQMLVVAKAKSLVEPGISIALNLTV